MNMQATPAAPKDAPLFAELADGPGGGVATWLTTDDNVQIRVVSWGQEAPMGTVLLFPGRTEYAEKYGPAAAELLRRGYGTLTIDWRGQGLADRLIPDTALGHVTDFLDYQRDVAAMMAHASSANLPRPFYLLAHSMGGCIGLRALHEGLDVDACAFTGPMWGIGMAPVLRPIAWTISSVGRAIGLKNMLSPGQSRTGYVLRQGFEGNTLTNNPEMFDWMRSHLQAQPQLGLGGPTLLWLSEALHECRALAALPAPDLPCITFLGADEEIVGTDAIHRQMAHWPKGTLKVVEGAQHEILMEGPAIRNATFDALTDLFVPTPAG